MESSIGGSERERVGYWVGEDYGMMEWVEFGTVWVILKMLGALPRGVARSLAATVARILYAMLPRLRRTAEFNLRLAFPVWDAARRRGVIRGMVRNLGWMAAEFARFPRYTRENIEDVVILDGHEGDALAGHEGAV